LKISAIRLPVPQISNQKSTISNTLGPLERAFAPCIVITHHENRYEHKHLDQCELSEGKVITHEYYRPRQKEDRLYIEY